MSMDKDTCSNTLYRIKEFDRINKQKQKRKRIIDCVRKRSHVYDLIEGEVTTYLRDKEIRVCNYN